MTRAIVFPGQGSQAIGMGKELYETFPIAKEVFQTVDDVLGQKLSCLMFEGPIEDLTLTANTQPALMAVSLAVMRVLEKEGGIDPTYFSLAAGHSLGEYSALAATKAITLEEATKLLRIRGNAMQSAVPQGKGAMVAVIGADLETLGKIIKDASSYGLCVMANDNSPGQVVLSGEKVAIEKVPEIAQNYGIRKCVILPVSAPFHCPLMAPAADAMKEALAPVAFKDPLIPIIPNVTAEIEKQGEVFKDLLVQQVTGQVRWRETMTTMVQEGITHVYEIGVGKVLSGLFKRGAENIIATSIHTPHDVEEFLKTK
ncbi:MAG: ACP S-malonyltransferase [Alphaproteobacteria bacterium]|nr:ACP S-malonyltransferase [Alphaproteobacteria bacterium]